GKKHGYCVNVSCPEGEAGKVTFEPNHVQRTVRVKEQSLRFEIQIEVQGSLVEETCRLDLSQRSNIEAIEKVLAKQYEKKARQVVNKVQGYKMDALQLGSELRAYHPRIWER